VPARYDRRVVRVFTWYSERLLKKQFAAVRLEAGGEEHVRALDAVDGPVLVAMSHAAWWDPIVAGLLWRRFFATRTTLAPMDRQELERFAFMRRLGIFGLDPDDATALPAMVAYLEHAMAAHPKPTLVVTPQGRFTDVREPMVVRPGAAAAAARLGVQRAVALAVEYGFWNDKKPEIFLRAMPIEVPSGDAARSTGRWQRALVEAMTENGRRLAELVRARDPSAFTNLLIEGAKVHPVYDLWLRLTGRGTAISTEHRAPARPLRSVEHAS
jgi:1-acyl-sn-glycerol-3-phosphate acyltransferase